MTFTIQTPKKKDLQNDEEEGKKKETFNEEELKDPVILMLDGIEDAHNLGAILRCADIFDVAGVVIPKRNQNQNAIVVHSKSQQKQIIKNHFNKVLMWRYGDD